MHRIEEIGRSGYLGFIHKQTIKTMIMDYAHEMWAYCFVRKCVCVYDNNLVTNDPSIGSSFPEPPIQPVVPEEPETERPIWSFAAQVAADKAKNTPNKSE